MSAGRRPKGEGSIFQRADGVWIASLDMPRTLDGKRRRVTRQCATEKIAYSTLRELRKHSEAGNLASPNVQLLAVIDAYLQHGIAASVREGTRAGYEYTLRQYVVPKLGRRKVAEVSPALVTKWRDALAAEGKSKRTIEGANQQLRAMFDWARRRELATTNPVRDAGAVTQGAGKRPTVRLDAEQARAYLAAAVGDKYELPVLTLIALGLRRSELVGIRWGDVDLEAGTIHIQRSITEFKKSSGTGVAVGKTKTELSNRVLAVPSYLLESLKRHRLASGTGQGYVFADADGTLPYPSTFTSRFASFKKRHALPTIPLANLRHTCANLMLEFGVPLEGVSQQLGHSNLTITKAVYAGAIRRLDTEARDVYETFLTGGAA